MNDQLEKQVILLRDKLGQLKIPSRDGKLTAAFFSVSCVKKLSFSKVSGG